MISLPRFLISSAMAAFIVLPPSVFAQQVPTTPIPSDSKQGPIVKPPSGDVEGLTEGAMQTGADFRRWIQMRSVCTSDS